VWVCGIGVVLQSRADTTRSTRKLTFRSSVPRWNSDRLVLLVEETVEVEARVCMMCCGVVATIWARGVIVARMLYVARCATHGFVLEGLTTAYRQSTDSLLSAPVAGGRCCRDWTC